MPSGLTSSGSAKNLHAIAGFGAAKTTARPGSASASRQRRPSISLDAIPESVNEHRPDSNYSKHHNTDSSLSPTAKSTAANSLIHFDSAKDAKQSYLTNNNSSSSSSSGGGGGPRGAESTRSDGIYHILNLNPRSRECEVKHVTASCQYPSVPHAPDPGTRAASNNNSSSSGGVQSDPGRVNWLCTGLSPQVLYLTFHHRMDIQHIRVQCLGEVEELSVQLYTQSLSTPASNIQCNNVR